MKEIGYSAGQPDVESTVILTLRLQYLVSLVSTKHLIPTANPSRGSRAMNPTSQLVPISHLAGRPAGKAKDWTDLEGELCPVIRVVPQKLARQTGALLRGAACVPAAVCIKKQGFCAGLFQARACDFYTSIL